MTYLYCGVLLLLPHNVGPDYFIILKRKWCSWLSIGHHWILLTAYCQYWLLFILVPSSIRYYSIVTFIHFTDLLGQNSFWLFNLLAIKPFQLIQCGYDKLSVPLIVSARVACQKAATDVIQVKRKFRMKESLHVAVMPSHQGKTRPDRSSKMSQPPSPNP